jgi:dihydrolipoamide dehydrogenase
MEKRDVVILGGGPAGYRAAIRVSQLGGKATLIDKDILGGTCINRGCIPVKALSRAAEMLDLTRMAKDYGVTCKDVEVDISKMISRKNIIVRTLVTGMRQTLSGLGIEFIEGTGELISPSQIDVQLRDGSKKEMEARRIIIATGAKWKKAAVPGGEKILTPIEAFEFKAIPKSMLIIGGGFVGTSIATIFSRMGTVVSLVEESPRILSEVDREIVSIFEKEMESQKIQIYTGAQVNRIEEKGENEKKVSITFKGKEANLAAQHVLIAEGRAADVDEMGLGRVGISLNEKGGIAVNKHMVTNLPTVLAAGDVTMGRMWTHVAYMEGIIAAENAMGKNSEIDYRSIPYGTNTLPEIASIGLTEDEAIAQGDQVKIGRFPFASNGLATVLGQRTGMIKIITEGKYNQIVGVHIIGPRASDLIAEPALAMKLEITPGEISTTLHLHPTLSEGFWEVARMMCGA